MITNAPAPTVGEIISTQFMQPRNLSPEAVAKSISVPITTIEDILRGNRIPADLSTVLSKFFDVDEDYFVRLQHILDARNSKIGKIAS